MAHYRKIDCRIWNDQKFNALSEAAKLVFFFVLTHPNLTMIGAMRATLPGLAAELRIDQQVFAEAFGEILAKGMAEHDERASFFWLPNFLKYNRPESPNVVRAWPHAFDLLPECELKVRLFERLQGFVKGLSKGFREAFRESFNDPFSKGMKNQEQNQVQNQEQEQEPEVGGTRKKSITAPRPHSPDKEDELEIPGEIVEIAASVLFRSQLKSNAYDLITTAIELIDRKRDFGDLTIAADLLEECIEDARSHGEIIDHSWLANSRWEQCLAWNQGG